MHAAAGRPTPSGSSRRTSTAPPTRTSCVCRCPPRSASRSTSRTSPHPTGSLKHRLARSLFLYGLCNGWIGPQTTIVEASRRLDRRLRGLLRLYARTALHRRDAALDLGREDRPDRLLQRESHFVDSRPRCTPRARLAAELGGHYMDQFTYAERATDWRGNNNIAESIFGQMTREEHPVPTWIVVGAGTGSTSATLGRYVRYRRLPTRLCLADPEASVFHRHLADRRIHDSSGPPSVIEGIGRLRCEPSFIPELIDRARCRTRRARRRAGPPRRIRRSCSGSTGAANMWAAPGSSARWRRAAAGGGGDTAV